MSAYLFVFSFKWPFSVAGSRSDIIITSHQLNREKGETWQKAGGTRPEERWAVPSTYSFQCTCGCTRLPASDYSQQDCCQFKSLHIMTLSVLVPEQHGLLLASVHSQQNCCQLQSLCSGTAASSFKTGLLPLVDP
jgi:hypothetical protein